MLTIPDRHRNETSKWTRSGGPGKGCPDRGGAGAVLDETAAAFSGGVSANDHVMTVSRNGQVSIPAAARRRWNARHVLVVDLGDRIVLRPVADDPVAELAGKYRDGGPTADVARRQVPPHTVCREHGGLRRCRGGAGSADEPCDERPASARRLPGGGHRGHRAARVGREPLEGERGQVTGGRRGRRRDDRRPTGRCGAAWRGRRSSRPGWAARRWRAGRRGRPGWPRGRGRRCR